MKSTHLIISLALSLLLILVACEERTPIPRSFGFPRIDLPTETTYQQFDSESCPFTFEYPTYAKITRDRTDSCWVDIYFPPFDCKWHFTYRDLRETGLKREAYFEEYWELVHKHSKKATEIRPTNIQIPAGYGTLFEMFGNVGTPAQLFLSDSTHNIMMSSFYFNTALKNDSLAPVIDHMKKEFLHMASTLKWKE